MHTVEDSLKAGAFEHQPTPTIVLSADRNVVSINRACQRLFDHPYAFVGRSVLDLPVRWQDGTETAFHEHLTLRQPNGGNIPIYHENAGSSSVMLRLRVELVKHTDQTLITARMAVVDFEVSGAVYRMLSFENIEETHVVQARMRRSGIGRQNSSHIDALSSSATRRKTHTSSRAGSYATAEEHLESKFAQLRDAIYFSSNDKRAGFLLSADETFCYPSVFTGEDPVTPVEIDDFELFFEGWEIFDAHFTKKISVEDYPVPWLSKNRTPFRNKRYGIKEAGKDLVIEVEGQPLYNREKTEYIGCVVWVTTLGEYADVVAADLQASLLDFRTICDRLPHLLWTVDVEGKANYFSQSWYDWTGLTEEESMGLAYTSIIDDEHTKTMFTDFAVAVECKSDFRCESRYRRKDGQYRWMSVRSRPLLDSNGKVLKFYGTLTEVHDIVVARLEAERKKAQLMAILSHAEIGLFEVTVEDNLRVLEGKLGWIDEHNTNLPITKLDEAQGQGVTILKNNLQSIMHTDKSSAVFEGQIGSRWYKFRLVGDGELGDDLVRPRKVLGCSVDVTEQHERANLEAENARLSAETSLETERNRLKTAFLAHVSHEVRTPIAGIIGTADVLAESNLNSDQMDSLADIRTSANNLLAIVNDILDHSKIEAGELQMEKLPFDVNELIAQVRKLFSFTARAKSIQLFCRVPGTIEMLSDPNRVTQIVTNLISNALKFTTKGSITISAEQQGANARIIVEDTGEGIDAQTMGTLFRPFVQGDASTARRHGGTGLGLTISRNLAQRMGGTLVLESTPSVGTKAILTLPKEMGFTEPTRSNGSEPKQSLTKKVAIDMTGASQMALAASHVHLPPESVSATRQPSPARGHHNQYHVLVVEDNAINQKIAINLVKKLGYITQATWNGQEALDILEHLTPTDSSAPSIILMDCQMPLLDGYEATRRLRTDAKYEKMKDTPVIALTASAIQGDREKCQAAGMDDYLSKPVNKALLKAMLEKWIPTRNGT
ncbi:hypothetical protein LTS08_003647 [Lithohypha guttulata]|nr:hypothetical protein LTS08_003647 [Lithohypha guttulata]